MTNLLLEHAENFVLNAQKAAVKAPKKIEVVYIDDEYKYINDENNKKLNKMDEVRGVKLHDLAE
jgi:sRNA-binding carbon storage regulator CsrA